MSRQVWLVVCARLARVVAKYWMQNSKILVTYQQSPSFLAMLRSPKALDEPMKCMESEIDHHRSLWTSWWQCWVDMATLLDEVVMHKRWLWWWEEVMGGDWGMQIDVVGRIMVCCRAHHQKAVFDQRISWNGRGIYPIRKSWFLQSKWWYIYIHTYTRGQDPEVAGFLFTYFYLLSSSSHGMIYRSLKRHFHVGSNSIKIVGIGSVVMDIFMYQG